MISLSQKIINCYLAASKFYLIVYSERLFVATGNNFLFCFSFTLFIILIYSTEHMAQIILFPPKYLKFSSSTSIAVFSKSDVILFQYSLAYHNLLSSLLSAICSLFFLFISIHHRLLFGNILLQ